MPAKVRFSAPVQTVPGAHAASYTMGTGSLPREERRTGRGVDHLLPSNTEVKERVELYLYPLWAFMACARVNFTFTLPSTDGRIVLKWF